MTDWARAGAGGGGAEQDHDGDVADFVGEAHGGASDGVLEGWVIGALDAFVGALGPPGLVVERAQFGPSSAGLARRGSARGWALPPLGAWRAASRMISRSSSEIGSGRMRRMARIV